MPTLSEQRQYAAKLHQMRLKEAGYFECEMCDNNSDGTQYQLNGTTVCRDCVMICDECGELISDETADLGPEVRIGQFKFAHAKCLEAK